MPSVLSPLRSLDLREHLPTSSECSLQLIEEAIGSHVDALLSGPVLPTRLWCKTSVDVSREAIALRLLPVMLRSRLSAMTYKDASELVGRWVTMERALLKKRLLSDAHVWYNFALLLECGVSVRPIKAGVENVRDWVR